MNKKSDRHAGLKSLYEAFLFVRPTRVMLVDQIASSREPLARALRAEGYEVIEVVESTDLFDCLGQPLGSCSPTELPDLIIADTDMFGGPGGFDVLSQLRRAHRSTPVILLAAEPDPEEQVQADRMGAAYMFNKTCSVDDVRYAALSLVEPR